MEQLNRYTTHEALHVGRDTVLYRAHRPSDGENVVFKTLRKTLPPPHELARLRHEHALLAEIHLPGIVRTFGLTSHEGKLALVLEHAAGTSLRALLRARRPALREVLSIAASLAGTLAELHRRGIVHRDIKPDNVVYDASTGATMLVDFGLATRLAQEMCANASAQSLEGTLAYLAPEQTGRMNRVIDARSDLYAFGVTLYEMLTGVLPFASSDPVELVYCHIARVPVPPHEIQPTIPTTLSDIVTKLLAKEADDRYQSAQGLQHDLDECLRRLDDGTQIAPFPLATRDRRERLVLTQALYGREAELATVLSALQRVDASAHGRLLLVAGSAGIGKSALVNEVRALVAKKRGFFVAGKFDQLHRQVPYSALSEALTELVRQLLTESEEVLGGWKAKIQTTLGINGQLVIDLIPDLALILGPQPPVEAVGLAESQNRFQRVLQQFVRLFATTDHPLVLFLDDLQWADAASLRLLEALVVGEGHVLVLAAYRDNEVEAGHPLQRTLAELAKEGVPVDIVKLVPLEQAHVQRLLADVLGKPDGDLVELAGLVQTKTQGNPFFVGQFLRALERDKLLWFSSSSGEWVWDTDGIRTQAGTENVVDFLVGQLRRIGADTQNALKLAACIGHQFDLGTLAIISQTSPQELAKSLREPLKEGMVVPLHGDHRLVEEATESAGAAIGVVYRFLHDRVQQAAYSLIEEEQRQRVHVRIGRLLRDRSAGALEGAEPEGETLFAVTHHLNIAADLITDRHERLSLARLNLAAGRKAKTAGAFDLAAGYLANGRALLGSESWDEQYDLLIALHKESIQCEFVGGSAETAQALFDTTLLHARTALEKAQLYGLRITLFTLGGKHAEALKVGQLALSMCSIDLPSEAGAVQAALQKQLAELEVNLAGRAIASLVGMAEMEDPQIRLQQELLTNMAPAAYHTGDQFLLALLGFTSVNLSLKYGNSDVSSYGYSVVGLVFAGFLGRLEEGHAHGKLAIALSERFRNAELDATVVHIFGGHIAHYREPLNAAFAYVSAARQRGLETGNLEFASYATAITAVFRCAFLGGDDLESIQAQLTDLLLERNRNHEREPVGAAHLTLAQRACMCLRGQTRGPTLLGDDKWEEAPFIELFERLGALVVCCWYYALKLQLAFLCGEHTQALAFAEAAEKNRPGATGMFYLADLAFFESLSMTALYGAAAPEERERYDLRLDAHEAALALLASNCPENSRHKLLLVRAERARIRGDALAAMALYDESLDAARERGYLRDTALASELCARYYLSLGRERNARVYLVDARYHYERWGALDKVQRLEAAYPQWLARGVESATATATLHTTHTGATLHQGGTADSSIDALSAMRSAQAISGELLLDRLVDKLVRILLENAGAERGSLLLQNEGRLEVSASFASDAIHVGRPVPLEEARDIAVSVVQYVARTGDTIILDEPGRDRRFAKDAHLVRSRCKSLMCAPMVQNGRVTGALYLENDAASHAFSPARIEFMKVLASQAAIALENARLYEKVRATTEQLRRANETLESQVARRTQELKKALDDLWSEMDLARKIQTVLLPESGKREGLEIAAQMIPASTVGGDYYDVFDVGGKTWVLIGDVSGHGVSAGLIMMMVQTAVRSVVASAAKENVDITPSRVLALVNTAVRTNLQRIGRGLYMTITALRWEGEQVRYAGLHQNILVRRAGAHGVESVETDGVWLGVLDEIGPLLEDQTLRLARGDTLVLFTDGVTESVREGKFFGEEGIIASLAAAPPDASCATLVERIFTAMRGYERDDDKSVVVLRRVDPAH